jgi:hypothetical protein
VVELECELVERLEALEEMNMEAKNPLKEL